MFYYQVDQSIQLRILEHRHAEELYQLVDQSREHLAPWMPWVYDTQEVKDTAKFIKSALKKFAEGTELNLGIWYHGQLAGVIGYHSLRAELKKAEIGYWIGKEFEGKGIITKATQALIRYCFEELGLNRVEISCALENTKSQMVARRLGFQEEGVHRQALMAGRKITDVVIFGKLVTDDEPIID